MAASAEERIRQLTQRMLRKRLFVILSKGAATAEQIGAVLPQHLEYMIGLEKAGTLGEHNLSGAVVGWVRAVNLPDAEKHLLSYT